MAILQRYVVFLALLGMLCFQQAAAQLYQRFELLTRQQGLSDNRVTCFLKDKTGFMWIGTQNGLNRYDGHDFTHFRPEKGNSISNEVINDIEQDSSGKLWVATMNGLNCYDPVQKTWQTYLASGTDSSKTLRNPIIRDCFVDHKDQVWVITDRHGPSVLLKDRKTFRHYRWRDFVNETLPHFSNSYYSLFRLIPKSENEFYLSSTIGLFLLHVNTGRFSLLGEGYKSSLLDMQYDRESRRVYIISSNAAVYCYDEQENTFTSLQPEKMLYPSTFFSSIEKDRTWLGYEEGLLLADKKNNRVFLLQHNPRLSFFIPPGGVNTIYHDSAGISWLATNNGVAKYDRNSHLTSFLPLMDMTDKTGSNPMGAVYFDHISGSYFVCSITGDEVFIINRSSGAVTRKKTDQANRPFQKCLTIKPDRNDQLWLLTGNHIYRYNRASGQFVLFPAPNGGEEVLFRDMTQDSRGNYWFASFHGPLYYFDSVSRQFTVPDFKNNFGEISKSTCLLSDTINHAVWIGTFSLGLYRYDLLTGLLTLYGEKEKTRHYSHLALINDIKQDNYGKLWVATHTGGLFVSTSDTLYERAFRQLSQKDGLSSSRVVALATQDSLLWAVSGTAIDAVHTRNNQWLFKLNEDRMLPFTSFTSGEEMPHFIFADSRLGELLVAAGGGMMICRSRYKPVARKFPVILSAVFRNNKPVADSIWQSAAVTKFSYPLKEITLEFAALHFTLPSNVKYEYRLEGFDPGWKEAININEVTYQNLSPGTYSFRVRAKDYAGNPSAAEKVFRFEVVPPFWKTWWFRSLVVLMISGLIYNRINMLRRKVWTERKINQFATSLYGQHTLDDIFWDIAGNCVSRLGFVDCVVYKADETKQVLLQVAASGPKATGKRELINPIEIPFGKGIVGSVAIHKKAELIRDTRKDERYMVDDARRLAELAVPVIVDGKLFGVIDSEHPQKGFYKQYHLRLLTKIADVCAAKISRYLVEENLRSKIARDLHDEMGSTLTSINIISKVAMQQSAVGTGIQQHLEKIKENSSRMMESMSDMVWAINPANDTFEKVAIRMKEFAAEILEPAAINYFFREEGQIEKAVLNPEQRKDIYLIFKEVLNNSVKYSNATEIDILLKKDEEFVLMQVRDNGKGFDKNKYNPGNGIRNIQNRAMQMGASVLIDSVPGTGTAVSLQLPIT